MTIKFFEKAHNLRLVQNFEQNNEFHLGRLCRAYLHFTRCPIGAGGDQKMERVPLENLCEPFSL